MKEFKIEPGIALSLKNSPGEFFQAAAHAKEKEIDVFEEKVAPPWLSKTFRYEKTHEEQLRQKILQLKEKIDGVLEVRNKNACVLEVRQEDSWAKNPFDAKIDACRVKCLELEKIILNKKDADEFNTKISEAEMALQALLQEIDDFRMKAIKNALWYNGRRIRSLLHAYGVLNAILERNLDKASWAMLMFKDPDLRDIHLTNGETLSKLSNDVLSILCEMGLVEKMSFKELNDVYLQIEDNILENQKALKEARENLEVCIYQNLKDEETFVKWKKDFDLQKQSKESVIEKIEVRIKNEEKKKENLMKAHYRDGFQYLILESHHRFVSNLSMILSCLSSYGSAPKSVCWFLIKSFSEKQLLFFEKLGLIEKRRYVHHLGELAKQDRDFVENNNQYYRFLEGSLDEMLEALLF